MNVDEKQAQLTQKLLAAREYISGVTGLQPDITKDKLAALGRSCMSLVTMKHIKEFPAPLLGGTVARLMERSHLSRGRVVQALKDAHALRLNDKSFLILPTRGDRPIR